MRLNARSRTSRVAALVLSMAALPVLAACTTGSASDTLSVSADEQTPHRSSDGYPDFSAPLKAAMSQMTDEEARQMGEELSALDTGRRAGTISEGQYWARVRQLQALARQHSADTITQIEAGPQ